MLIIHFENQAEYSCGDGFVLDGDSYRICLSTGIWSSEPPACIPIGK